MMSRAKRLGISVAVIFGLVVLSIAILLIVAAVRALTLKEKTNYIEFDGEDYAISEEQKQRYLQAFGDAIKLQTVSKAKGDYDTSELLKLHHHLEKSFPLLFNSSFIKVETVNTYSLLFTVQGSNPTVPPFMMTSHLDVVPVDPERWTHPPFLGEVVPDPNTGEDCMWGRGAIDVKAGVMGILSALDILVSSGWEPKRSFYVAFGHDEEVAGFDGAGHVGQLLSRRNVSLDFLLDEGMPLVEGVMKGIDVPVALIGVTEKGRMDVRISAEGPGGHSSIPPKDQAVEKLSRALTRLYENPHPSMFGFGPEKDMLEYLAPSASWPYKLLFANSWLFGPLLSLAMSRKSQSDALLRTTTAVTIVKAGIKNNVVPASAWANVNHRIHPSQNLAEVLAHDRAAIADDQIKVEMVEGVDAHPISPYGPSSLPYKLIAGAVKHVYPEAVTAPAVMVGNTDTKHYLHLTPHIYRLLPFHLNPSTIGTIHGDNERLSVSNFESAILFYKSLIENAENLQKYNLGRFGRQAGEL